MLEPQLTEAFGVRTVLAVSSGKAALTLALQALTRLTGRRKVIVPAYTCYSVPSAIVKAGLDVVPCDIAPRSFDYDFAQLAPMLGPDVLCVVSVHLLGVPSDTARLRQMCEPHGIFVVEDAAQAFGGSSEGRRLGTAADVGIFSLGRGKALSCGTGGVIVTSSEAISSALNAVTHGLEVPTWRDDVMAFVTLLLTSIFIVPALYWFPSSLPFLRLGETIFHPDFPVRWLSDFQARLLSGWPQRLAALNAVRTAHADGYAARLGAGGAWPPAAVPYLRYPVLVANPAAKLRVTGKQGSRAGISALYPATLTHIPELQGTLAGKRFPQAEAMAERLVTLPTHPLLTPGDHARVCELAAAAVTSVQEARLAS